MHDHYDKFYDVGGWQYNKRVELDILRSHVIAPAGWVSGDCLLEIGCGLGLHSKLLHDEGFKVTGVDVSSVGILKAKTSWVGPEFVCQDLSEYQPAVAFDGILSRGMSWFHYNLDHDIQRNVRPSLETWRMFRWLKPGGTFVLQVCTDFTGTRPTGSVHNNTVRDYLLLFEPLGTVISLTDWAGTSLKPDEAGHKGVIVVTRNEVT